MLIEGETGSTYTLTDDDVGKVITAEVTYTAQNGQVITLVTPETPTISQRLRRSVTVPQGEWADKVQENRASEEMFQWMNRISQSVNEGELSGGPNERPTKALYPGRPFWDTSLNKPIFSDGTGIWYDSNGELVE